MSADGLEQAAGAVQVLRQVRDQTTGGSGASRASNHKSPQRAAARGAVDGELLACLKDGDRLSFVVETAWAVLWQQLGRAGDPPASRPLLAALTTAALTESETVAAADMGEQVGDPGRQTWMHYRLHPGVAAAIIVTTDRGMRDAVDAVIAELREVA